jgi:hypothetical protein
MRLNVLADNFDFGDWTWNLPAGYQEDFIKSEFNRLFCFMLDSKDDDYFTIDMFDPGELLINIACDELWFSASVSELYAQFFKLFSDGDVSDEKRAKLGEDAAKLREIAALMDALAGLHK